MQQITFRKCQLEDWILVKEIASTTFEKAFGHQNNPSDMQLYMEKAFSEQQTKKELGHPNSAFYLAELDQKIVGYFKLNWEDAQSESIKDALEIERIYLLPANQGLRIGQRMMNAIFEIAKNKKINHLWLGVWDKNDGAIRFYKRNGFRPFSKHQFLLGKDLQTDILMEMKMT